MRSTKLLISQFADKHQHANQEEPKREWVKYKVRQLKEHRCMANQLSSAAQSCPTPCDPMNCSTPSFPVHHQLLELAIHGIFQARVLEWGAIAFSLFYYSGVFASLNVYDAEIKHVSKSTL